MIETDTSQCKVMRAQQQIQERLPLIVFEDDHLLVLNKPAGLNTHAPSPFAGEGVYDWLRHREPRWATLAIIHRLDKETSGLLVFGKSPVANRSLTQQFTRHSVRKKYLLLTDRAVQRAEFTAISTLVRSGEKYDSRPLHAGGARAETRFHLIRSEGGRTAVQAQPMTGRTHQIRVQAAEHGFPILGDTLYGGTPAPRLCLHAEALAFNHPATGAPMTFQAPADFLGEESRTRAPAVPLSDRSEAGPAELPYFALREAMIDLDATNAYRIVHGAFDGWPGWYLDRLGEFLLSQSERPLTCEQTQLLKELLARASREPWPSSHSRRREEADSRGPSARTSHAPHTMSPPLRGAYHKILKRGVHGARAADASPQHVLGEPAPERFLARENGVQFELSFSEGYSVGLFLDQRDNRRRFLANHVAAHFPLFLNPAAGAQVLNTFAYTCGFSVCAARAGAKTTSLDLSRKYLEWGKRNFAANQIDPAAHDFIYGDVFDWLGRLAKQQRRFEVIVLDPPTFSRSKEHGPFQAEKDYGKLALTSLPLLQPGGVLFASTNAATWEPEKFLAVVSAAVRSARRKILQQHYVPQPPDFPISRKEPAYLKTVWMRIQ